MYSGDYVLTNAWAKTISENTYLVYAGALSKDTLQGIVYVQSPQTFGFKKILSPNKNGVLTIIAENNLVLTLKSEKGDFVFFDATREQFVDDKGNPITPTAYP